MIDDGTLFRMGENNFRWIGGDDASVLWIKEQAAKSGINVLLKTASDQIHNVAVQGPKSRDILRRHPLDAARPPGARGARLVPLHGWPLRRLRRHSRHGLAHRLHGRTRLRSILPSQATRPRCGTRSWKPESRMASRHSALRRSTWCASRPGSCSAATISVLTTDPIEAGIGFTVPSKKEEDYIGKAAIERRRANPLRKLVGLEIEGNEKAAHGDPVFIGRAQIGMVTSARARRSSRRPSHWHAST